TIKDSAAVGLRDVTVNDAGGAFKLAQAFELQSPVAITTSGLFAQGSVAFFSMRQLAFSTPFDTTCGFSIFGQCFPFANIQIASPPGTFAVVDNVVDYQLQGRMFIDVDAAAAGGALSVTSGPSGSEIISTQGAATTITARSATALTAGMATNGTIAPGETALYSFAATANSVVPFPVTTTATPSLFLLPSSGHFADLMSTGANDAQGNTLTQLDAVTATATTFYVIYGDDGSGTSYSI